MNSLNRPIIDYLYKTLPDISNVYESNMIYNLNSYLNEKLALELDGEMGELRNTIWI